MKFPFRIPPFGNWTVSESGVAQDDLFLDSAARYLICHTLATLVQKTSEAKPKNKAIYLDFLNTRQ